MRKKIDFEVPTWDLIYNMLLNLADDIRRNGFRADLIVGVSRGGWPPARVLSDLLGNPNLANVKAEFYVGVAETKGEPTLTQQVSVPVRGKKVLIVDEVADTGKSLKLVKKHITDAGATEVRTATVYYKPWSKIKPDYYERKTSDWVVFPWEVKETVRKILRKCREENVSPDAEIQKLAKAGVHVKLVKRFIREIIEEEHC